MSIITLTSDFGYKDYHVAAIKGNILTLNPALNIIDITHQISPHNLLETVHIVKNAYPHFPKGTVHIISVDSFFHKDRKNLIVESDGHYFICADNGIISLLFNEKNPDKIYEITINNRFDDVVHFTSTDIFVPCAVHLKNGGIPELIGREIKEIISCKFPTPQIKENSITGEVIYIDEHENIITNIHRSTFENQLKYFSQFAIKVRILEFKKIYESYTGLVKNWSDEKILHGKEGFYFNKEGFLTFFIYKGYKQNGAKSLFRLKESDKIFIEFYK